MSDPRTQFEYEGFDGATREFDKSPVEQFSFERQFASLRILRGADAGMRIPLTKSSVTIGRDSDVDLCLEDVKISRAHARIDRIEGSDEYSLTDLGSTNGTFLNNQPLRGTEKLRDGDKIFLGHTILKFTLEDDVDSQGNELVDRFLFKDDLTGLVVKRRFYNELKVRLRAAASCKAPLALLMMDMDGLKGVNDVHGHSMGAFVISEAGKRIGAICNPIGQACRFGGDEFVAYLIDHDKAAALAVAARICAAVRDQPFERDGHVLNLSISVGVAVFPEHGGEVELLNRAADEALYRAKAKGRNTASD